VQCRREEMKMMIGREIFLKVFQQENFDPVMRFDDGDK
jgi:hypothetical protein